MPEFPISMLRHSSRNMRTVRTDDDLDSLMASMVERHARGLHPLIQNLRGVQVSPKKVEIHAGGRRLTALLKLRNANQIPNDIKIPVELDAASDALEVSIMENTLRVPPHPYDQFVSFKKLADTGLAPEQIAQRFGTKPNWVRQRLALAGLHPELLELLKRDELPIACAQALTISSDQNQQLDTWMRLPSFHRDQHQIRRILRDARTPVAAAFFPIQAYIDEGGIVERDLFDEKDQGSIGSPALFARMQREAVDQKIAELRAEWGEVIECDPTHSWYHWAQKLGLEEMDRAGTRGLTDAEMAEYDTLTKRHDEIHDKDEDNWEAEEASLQTELQQIEDRLEQLDGLERQPVFSPEQKKNGVVLVLYTPPNNLTIRLGYMRPQPVEQEPQADEGGGEQKGQPGHANQANDNPQPPRPKLDEVAEDPDGGKPYASAVLDRLAVAKSHAIQDLVAGDYEMALRVATYHLIDGGFRLNPGYSGADFVCIRQIAHCAANSNQALADGMAAISRKIGLADDTATPAYRHEEFIARHPERWQAILGAPFSMVTALFAYLVARSVGVHSESMKSPAMYADIVEGYGLRMVNRWRPDAKFLLGLTKAQLHAILVNNQLAELSIRWKECKKPDLVDHMQKMFDGLPPAGLGPTAQAAVLDLIGTWVPHGLDFYTPQPDAASEAAD